MKKLLLLILCTAATLDAAAAPLSLIPEAGPHAVGLHIVQQYDYSRAMEVQLIAHLRDEAKFHGLDALVEQMRRDEAQARALLGA